MARSARDKTTVVDPEVLPPEGRGGEDDGPSRADTFWSRLTDAFGPLAVGLAIDVINFVTRGPAGLLLGLALGGTLAYAVTSAYRLPVWQRFVWALAAGLYCMLPRFDRIPLATLTVALMQFWKSGRRTSRRKDPAHE